MNTLNYKASLIKEANVNTYKPGTYTWDEMIEKLNKFAPLMKKMWRIELPAAYLLTLGDKELKELGSREKVHVVGNSRDIIELQNRLDNL